jgi:membrane associated rhomboid family serine protease
MPATCNNSVQPARLLYLSVALLAAACNLHLLRGAAPSTLIFRIDRVLDGQWYRLLTHPLVHVSWYHLLLDTTCMGLLFHAVRLPPGQKLAAVLFCGSASLGCAILWSPDIARTGFCGLSGIAHGFMFLAGWLWVFAPGSHDRDHRGTARLAGLVFCLVSLGKSLYEVHLGQILFQGGHTGSLGVPIVHSHLGGVIGGMLSALLFSGRAPGLRPMRQDTGSKVTTEPPPEIQPTRTT